MANDLFKETFSHVRSSYEFKPEDFERRERPKRRLPVRQLFFVAAAVAVLAALGITASATGFFGLSEPQPEHKVPDIPQSQDVLFVEGYDQTPEGLAWEEYAGGGALEEIAAKYGLALAERSEVYTYAQLTGLLGGEFLLGGHVPAAAGIYEDGSFRLEGVFVGPGGRQVSYELIRSVKGGLHYTDLSHLKERGVRPFDAGERTLALAEGDGETLLVTDLGQSWAALSLRGTGLDMELLSALGASVDWEKLSTVRRPDFPERTAPVTFGAGVELDQERVLEQQSFSVNLAGLGRVRFISYAPTEGFNDARFFFSADGRTSLSELTPVLTGLTFEQVAAVSFEDLNGDSFADILLLIDYKDGNGESSRQVRIYTALGNGEFTLEYRIGKNIEAAVDNAKLNVYAVRAYLRSAGATELVRGAGGYARVLAEKLRTYGGPFTAYTLYDLTGDGEAELIAGKGGCEAEAEWDIWTMREDEPVLLGTVGASHAVLYDSDGRLLKVAGQMDWETVTEILWDGEEIREELLSERLLTQYESYAEPGTPLLMISADDISLIEPMSYEEVISRAGKLGAGPDSLVDYVLWDMNGDGGEELILRVQDEEVLSCYRFYTLSQGRAVPLGEISTLYDTELVADGTTLYLLERDLESGSERIHTVVYTGVLTEADLSSRTGLSPADFTSPGKLGQPLEFSPAPAGR